MNLEERKRLLEELHKTAYGKALSSYLDEEIAKIDTVRGITSYEEVLGRRLALEVIGKVLNFLENTNPHKGRKKEDYT